MIKNIDKKVGYWIVIAIPIAALCTGFLAFNWIEWLYPIPVILIGYLLYSLHRCTECNKPIFSWDRRCRKCGNPDQYYKI